MCCPPQTRVWATLGLVTDQHASSAFRLEDLTALVRAHLKSALIVAVVVAALAFLLTRVLFREYEAEMSVTVTPPPTLLTTATRGADLNMTTEVEIASSPVVAAAASGKLGGSPDAESVQDATSVANPPQSEVIQIRATAATPDDAARIANAVGEEYLAYRASSALETVEEVSASIRQQLEVLGKEAAKSDSIEAASIRQQMVELRGQLNALASLSISGGRVIGPALPPTRPAGPGLLVSLVGALGLGCIAGLTWVFVRDSAEGKVGDARRVRRLTGLPPLDPTDPGDRQQLEQAIVQHRAASPGTPVTVISLDGGVPQEVQPLVNGPGFHAASPPQFWWPGVGAPGLHLVVVTPQDSADELRDAAEAISETGAPFLVILAEQSRDSTATGPVRQEVNRG